ncbi:MAG: undecaprenyl-diphosphate phosphatase [Phycisphaerales bacterium]|nr:undecaprenyl-diphosphate phosphatase [Phycisphaerales bacterium]
MADFWRAVILGVIEGLTEFLPVSSTGHMLLAMPELDIDPQKDPWPAFLYFIQIGAIVAVVVYFWRRLWRQTFSPPKGGIGNHVIIKLIVGMIPAAVIGIPLNDLADQHLGTQVPVAVTLILGAVVMILIERVYRREDGPKIEDVTLKQAFLIGVAQCVSIIPGTSRSMATIMGGMMVGLPAATAAEFSFYLAIPTIFGAGLLGVIKDWASLSSSGMELLAVGFVVSFLVAWVVVASFMRYIQTRSLYPFAVYRVLLGITVLAYWWFSR